MHALFFTCIVLSALLVMFYGKVLTYLSFALNQG